MHAVARHDDRHRVAADRRADRAHRGRGAARPARRSRRSCWCGRRDASSACHTARWNGVPCRSSGTSKRRRTRPASRRRAASQRCDAAGCRGPRRVERAGVVRLAVEPQRRPGRGRWRPAAAARAVCRSRPAPRRQREAAPRHRLGGLQCRVMASRSPALATAASRRRRATAARLRRCAGTPRAVRECRSAFSTPMSLAGKASGQASARIAISCAVHSPMPGSARSASQRRAPAARRGAARCGPRHRARQRLQRADALAHDAELADRVGRRPSAIACGAREQRACRSANGVSIGSPKRSTSRARQRARGRHRDLLAEDRRAPRSRSRRRRRARAGPAAAPGSAASAASIGAGSASRSSAWRTRCDHRAERRRRASGASASSTSWRSGTKRRGDPAGDAAARDARSASVRRRPCAVDRLDAGDARARRRSRASPRRRRAAGRPGAARQRVCALRPRHARRARASRRSARRAQAVALDERGVEAAQAREAAGQRHLRHRQRRCRSAAAWPAAGAAWSGSRSAPRRARCWKMRRRWRSVTPRRAATSGSASVAAVVRGLRRAVRAACCASTCDESTSDQPRRQLGPAAQAGPEAVAPRRCAALAKKRQFSRRGVRTRHTGRQ